MPDSGKQDTEIRENITMKTNKRPFLAAILNRMNLSGSRMCNRNW